MIPGNSSRIMKWNHEKSGKRWRREERGAAAVEYAVVCSLLILFVLGILEFSFIFYQRHYIANAAREGMRVGIRADNFNCFNGKPAIGCTEKLDRRKAMVKAVYDYLDSLYKPLDILPPNVEMAPGKSLRLTITVNNFFPSLLSGFIPGLADQATLTYSTTGRYENPDEYDLEEPKHP